jgi:hypothetical protein
MRLRNAAVAAVLSGAIGVGLVHAETVKFPGRVYLAPSPDKQATIVNTDNDEEPNHVLSIRDKTTTRGLFTYERNVDISWAPDSKFFFVNDYFGSDVSRCIVVDRRTLNKYDTLNLLQEEMDRIISHYKGSMWYVTCSSWRKGDKVRVTIRVAGNGTQEEVRKQYLFDAKAGKFAATR